MYRVLVCPFGDVNLLLTLFEKLQRERRGDYEITYLSFTEYGKAIYGQLAGPHVHVPVASRESWFGRAELDQLTRYSCHLAQRNLGCSCRSFLSRAANHYGNWFHHHLAQRYDHVVLFNGQMNLVIAVLEATAQKLGIPRLVFEQGLFRPGYITVDPHGVNQCNSVSSLQQLLSADPFPYQRDPLFEDLQDLLPLGSEDLIDFKGRTPWWALAKAYLRTKLRGRKCVFLRAADGRDLLESALAPHKPIRRTNRLPDAFAERKYDYYLLCPLQVATDTQVLLHSGQIGSMQQFVDTVVDAVSWFNTYHTKKICAIFKTHPSDVGRVTVDHEDALLVNESTVGGILDAGCHGMVTINSSAAMVALERGLPVITLGDAFFNMKGVVVHCPRPDRLGELLEKTLRGTETDSALQCQVTKVLKQRYQLRVSESKRAC